MCHFFCVRILKSSGHQIFVISSHLIVKFINQTGFPTLYLYNTNINEHPTSNIVYACISYINEHPTGNIVHVCISYINEHPASNIVHLCLAQYM